MEELKANVESTEPSIYNDFSSGNPTKELPLWSNYKIVYQITESFIENNPDTTILEWTKLDANELVKDSKYSNLLE
ncbi:hypothetical protein D8M05_18305 [Oceanobacillus bengalensis]|uniref:Uncharacterized protein n=1 Tax=Oceanobacillus bengalensis TaxID=1435466 RepID=A0A494YRZ2_9BACI|nr:hypothetical protein D8M05_18305 [Oceanobacillus bengalensis]